MIHQHEQVLSLGLAMEQRESLDRSSSEAPAQPPVSAFAPDGPGFNGANIPTSSGKALHTEQETTPVVDSVLQSDVGLDPT